ncbi:MAG: DUF167 domain-containing protein [bacterium]
MAEVVFKVRVVPNASRSEVAGWQGDVLRVRIQAPAVEGKANAALVEFLAGELGLKRRDVQIEKGLASREKLVRVTGRDAKEIKVQLKGK